MPTDVHDVPVDLVVTPTRVLGTGRSGPRRQGLDVALLTDEKVASIPLLQQLDAQ